MSSWLNRIKIPHVFTLLTLMIFICSLLTYVIPSGEYQREVKNIDGRDRSLVVPGSYESIPKHYSLEGALLSDAQDGKASPVGLHGFLTAIPRGMESAGDIIFFIFIIGGVLGVLRRTGVVLATIKLLLDRFRNSSVLLTVVIMTAVAVGGSTLGMGEEFIPLVPIFILVANQMGYDRIYGMAIVILAAQVGFAAATTNPFTLGVAQGIAELPLYSGMGFRIIFLIVCLAITSSYLIRYGAKIKADPKASLIGEDQEEVDSSELVAFNGRHLGILISSVAIFGVILYFVTRKGWWMADMGGGFILIGMVAILISGISIGEAVKAFVEGMEEMVVAALVVGFAKGVEVVLSDAQIMDTLIFAAASILEDVPRMVAVQGMFFFQTMLNFLIPSGSGQATVTMPLMAPLADVLGLTRQTAVFAFQCGDGFSNLIIPTSSILMSMLALAKIPYEKWLRFMVPLLIQLWIASMIFLAIAVAINFS